MTTHLVQDIIPQYVEMGLTVLPLCSADHKGMSTHHKQRCSTPGKVPLIAKWTQHKRTTREDIDQWLSKWPTMNVGLVLGQTVHWNMVGIDVDGEIGLSLLEEYSKGDLPATWEYTTGNGRRLLYLLPSKLVTKKHRITVAGQKGELAILCQGQQTVLPPSKHASGCCYTWLLERSPWEIDIAEAPLWVKDLIIQKSPIEDLPNFSSEDLSTPVIPMENQMKRTECERSNYLVRQVGALVAKGTLDYNTVLTTAGNLNINNCVPPLTNAEVLAMVDSIWNSEQEKRQAQLTRQRKRMEATPAALASAYMTHLKSTKQYLRVCIDRGIYYHSAEKKGPWKARTREFVETDLYVFLKSMDEGLATKSKIQGVEYALAKELEQLYGSGEEFDQGKSPQLLLIATQDGLLNWRTGSFVDWNPEYNNTLQITANWDPDVTSSKAWSVWQEALHEWLPDQKSVLFLQEYIGYSLLPNNKMRCAAFLYGQGANGKSLFLDCTMMLFGSSVVFTSPKALEKDFNTTQLLDKAMAINSDIDDKYLQGTGVLKQIIAGDPISAEYKYGKRFDFRPTCKLLFSANSLPKASDKSFGWYSRLKIVYFPRQFTPNQQYYQDMVELMGSEEGRSVMLYWAVEGLKRLNRQGHFTESVSMQRELENYRRDNDNVLAFAKEALLPSSVEGGYKTAIITSVLYSMYKHWCDLQGTKCTTSREFVKRLKIIGYTMKTMRWRSCDGRWKTFSSVANVLPNPECPDLDTEEFIVLQKTMLHLK